MCISMTTLKLVDFKHTYTTDTLTLMHYRLYTHIWMVMKKGIYKQYIFHYTIQNT